MGALGPTSLVGPLAASALAFALAAPGVDRWFEPGAVAARGVSIGPFVAAIAGLELVVGALVLVTTSFAKMFAELGETVDGPTEVLFAVSVLVGRHVGWLAPLLLLASVPLLWLPRRRARPAIEAVVLLTFVGLGHAVGLPLLAVSQLSPLGSKL